uniref:Aminotransferase-like protein n=1 Tax=Oryza sativa subsp. japonica TaxID=39947 RepID=Q6Z0V3_ORYSJ|nr:aminotransferase-like protein [Oryza sativa Japonica Group]
MPPKSGILDNVSDLPYADSKSPPVVVSSSASPSAPLAEYAEHLSNLVAIPSLSHENHYFLGPIGNLDPTEFIVGEPNRVPFRLANPDLGHWKNTFKSWPSLEKTPPEKSWITWYKRVSASKKVHWNEIGIGQALALTIANSAKDEPLMAAATYFWSNTINAFLFNQGSMTPTLINITMITGLDITSLANPMSMNTKNQFYFRTKSIGGWSGYAATYMDLAKSDGHESCQLAICEWKMMKKNALIVDACHMENTHLRQPMLEQSCRPSCSRIGSAAFMRTTESSPPHQSNSGRDIKYAPGLIPNGGGLSPPVIGYNAPKTSTLLQGLIREPSDAGKKRRTRSSATDTLALALKKKAKLKKPKPADDLPVLDPSIEQALDEEDIEDDVDQAVAEVSDTERTPSASPKQTPPTPYAPTHFSRKKKIAVKRKLAATILKPVPPQSSSDRTPSAVGSHHIEEEIQPAAPTIPALADLFSFDIKDYLDEEAEEDTTSKSLLVHEEKTKLDQLSEGPIKSNINRLEARKIELLAQLEECNAELDIEHKKLADLPKSIEEQKARLKSAIKNVAVLTKYLKIIPGTNAQDAQAIEEVEQIRQRAISAIQHYLSQ